MKFVIRLLITALVIFGVAYLSGGWLLSVENFVAAFWAALVLAIVNAVVRPVVGLLSLPITLLTFGLFALVLNAFMIYLVAWVVPGVATNGFFPTLLAAIVISISTAVLSAAVKD